MSASIPPPSAGPTGPTHTSEPRSQSRPFEGLLVVDLGQIYNGPYCGLMFAYLGADVIKVEPPRGELLRYRSEADMESREFMMLNSSKRSLPLDLKNSQGRDVFLDLIEKADVVIENFSLDVMDRLGLSTEVLYERNPRLIYARGSGYGREGPYAGYSAMDLTVQALAGVIATTGFPEGPPVKAGPAFVDFMAGIHLFAAAVTALYQRELDGTGRVVQTAMYDVVVPALASPMAARGVGKNAPERVGNRHSGLSVAPYNVYETVDGHVAIFCASEHHWRRLLACMQSERLADDPRFATPHSRAAHIDAVDEIVTEWTSSRSRAEVVEALRRLDVPTAPVQTVEEVMHDEHLISNGMIQKVRHWGLGEVIVPGCAIRLPGDPPVAAAAPLLGADTEDLLVDLLGYSEERVQALVSAGVTVVSPDLDEPLSDVLLNKGPTDA